MGEGEREGGWREGGGAGPGRATLTAPPRPGPRPGEPPRTRGWTASVPGGRRGAQDPSPGEQRDQEGAAGAERKLWTSPSMTDPLPTPCGGLGAGSALQPRSLRRRGPPSPDSSFCQFLAPRVVLVVERGWILPHATSVLLGCDFGWNNCIRLRND